MKKKPPRAKKARRRAEARGGTVVRDKSTITKPPKLVLKEKEEPIKCASPPCYLPEIED